MAEPVTIWLFDRDDYSLYHCYPASPKASVFAWRELKLPFAPGIWIEGEATWEGQATLHVGEKVYHEIFVGKL